MASIINIMKNTHKPLFYFGLVNIMAFFLCVLLIPLTELKFLGIHALIKPAKFFISGAIFNLSMLYVIHFIKDKKGIFAYGWMLIVVFSYENIYILIRAIQQQASHFNISTPVSGMLFSLMGIAISIAMFWTAIVGIQLLMSKTTTLNPVVKTSIVLGILICVVFSFEGGLMAAKLRHTIGANDGTAGIPFLNWSRTAGDLRIAHFAGIHALQIIPLITLLFFKRNWQVVLFSVGYSVLCGTLLLQALKGSSLFTI